MNNYTISLRVSEIGSPDIIMSKECPCDGDFALKTYANFLHETASMSIKPIQLSEKIAESKPAVNNSYPEQNSHHASGVENLCKLFGDARDSPDIKEVCIERPATEKTSQEIPVFKKIGKGFTWTVEEKEFLTEFSDPKSAADAYLATYPDKQRTAHPVELAWSKFCKSTAQFKIDQTVVCIDKDYPSVCNTNGKVVRIKGGQVLVEFTHCVFWLSPDSLKHEGEA